MRRPVAILTALGSLALSACSVKVDAVDCAARFADIARNFSAIVSPIDASYIFDAGDRGKDPEFIKRSGSLEVVADDGRLKIAEFEKRDFKDRPAILMAEGKTLIGIGKTIKGSKAAVEQGCALEKRYGTLRTVRLTSVNPNVGATTSASTTISTKNER